MSTIEPGTPVRVIIDGYIDEQGVQLGQYAERTGVRTASGAWSGFPFGEPGVQVVPVDPERPTLEQVLEQHAPFPTIYDPQLGCKCGHRMDDSAAFVEHLAEQLRAAGVAL